MSESKGKVAFEMRKREVELTRLLPTKAVRDAHNLKRYRAIVDSIPELGLIEPLMVYPQKGVEENWVVLDGHLRLLAVKQLGWKTVEVIVANDDDRYTYNNRVNRLPPIQAHKMIVKAVRNGVKPERIAKALSMPMKTVSALIDLLDGINPEAAELLKDKHMTADAIRLLRKVTSVRQIEIAEVMVSANNFTKSYAEALVLATSRDQMVSPQEEKKKAGLTAEELARMEREMEALEHDFKGIESTYTENIMSLTLARGYIKKLLDNGKVIRFLNGHHADILTEFQRIAAAESL
ncbi:MAG TPA: plasmid partitioning protein RepB C-terminal domain-containing protein [Methylomirabilota bacterium]|nr:plasmid partitioning protein RepB C-terminal domain-containing protein [Methylomirabilota bacterium]